jgi:hypothetical protein
MAVFYGLGRISTGGVGTPIRRTRITTEAMTMTTLTLTTLEALLITANTLEQIEVLLVATEEHDLPAAVRLARSQVARMVEETALSRSAQG